jgi:Fe2+ or Zn2+ uptake regulation protein
VTTENIVEDDSGTTIVEDRGLRVEPSARVERQTDKQDDAQSANPEPEHQHPPTRHPYVDRLRRLGVRVTPQRLFVLEALEQGGGHMTAEEIMRWAMQRYPAINLATIYRTLDLLIDVGLVAQIHLDAGATSFELVGAEPHHHLVCEHCGAVIEMDETMFAALGDRLLAAYGFHARPRHMAIFGLCRVCAANEEPTPVVQDAGSDAGSGE